MRCLAPRVRVLALLFGCLTLTPTLAARRGTPSAPVFDTPMFDLGGLPHCGTAADLNGDDITDLVACTQGTRGGLAILMGGPRGLREPDPFVDWGGGVDQVLAGEFNGDARTDLLTVASGWVTLHPGGGDGTFGKSFEVSITEESRQSAAAADFDKDGALDLALAGYSSAIVSILFGRGDGTFVGPMRLAVGRRPHSVAAADFDGDGRVDVVTVNVETHDLSLLLGRGRREFSEERRLKLGPRFSTEPPLYHAHDLAAGDLNGDGLADLVVTHQDSDSISILLGSKEGVLISGGDHRDCNWPLTPQIIDVDGDGNRDILVGCYATNDVLVLLGNGKGEFATARRSGVCEGPGLAVAGHFQGGKRIDVGVGCRNSKAAGAFRGNGDGTFGPAVQPTLGFQAYETPMTVALAAGEFDRNRGADVAVAHRSQNRIAVLHDLRNGAFQSTESYEVGWNPTSLTAGRFSRGGPVDLAIAVRNFDAGTDGPSDCRVTNKPYTPPDPPRGDVVVLPGLGDGRFGPAVRIPVGYRPAVVKSADLNGDGLDDLLVGNRGETRVHESGALSVVLADAAGTFLPERRFFEGDAVTALAVADFDVDGRLDVAVGSGPFDQWAGRTGDVTVHYGAGDGSFTSTVSLHLAWVGGRLEAGDLDADGRPDLLVTNTRWTEDLVPAPGSSVTIFYSRPERGFARGETMQDGNPIAAMFGEFDGNRRADLAILNGGHAVTLIPGVSAGTFLPRSIVSASGPIARLLVADLDGDGRDDLVGGVGGRLALLLNRPRGRR